MITFRKTPGGKWIAQVKDEKDEFVCRGLETLIAFMRRTFPGRAELYYV